MTHPRQLNHFVMSELNLFMNQTADGELTTRFPYMKVPAQDFGLSTESILQLQDRELNSRVSLKRLAPYRTDRNLQMSWSQLKAMGAQRHSQRQQRPSNGSAAGTSSRDRRKARRSKQSSA